MDASSRCVNSDHERHAGAHDRLAEILGKQKTPREVSAVELNGKVTGLGQLIIGFIDQLWIDSALPLGH